jgi:hypothetical protein
MTKHMGMLDRFIPAIFIEEAGSIVISELPDQRIGVHVEAPQTTIKRRAQLKAADLSIPA